MCGSSPGRVTIVALNMAGRNSYSTISVHATLSCFLSMHGRERVAILGGVRRIWGART